MERSRYILFADDDEDDQELLQEAFESINRDLKVETVATGKEVLSFLHSKKDNELPCLIILDYNIPDLTGAKILKLISENPRYLKIPKVVWSTSSLQQYVQISLAAGADYYFEKPRTYSAILKLAGELVKLCN